MKNLPKYYLLFFIVAIVSFVAKSQTPVWSYSPEVECGYSGTPSGGNLLGGLNSEYGDYLSPHGDFRILILFVEVNYNTQLVTDPHGPNGTTSWPAGQLPTYKDDMVDPQVSTNPQGMLTKFPPWQVFGVSVTCH